MVEVWVNGKLDIRVRYAVAEVMGNYLRTQGWSVRWMPDLQTLALFTPEKEAE